MTALADLLDRLERLLAAVDELDGDARELAYDLLDGVDLLHRHALERLAAAVGDRPLAAARRDPAARWLLDAYGVGVDQAAAAEAALDRARPRLEAHGGDVRVLEADRGVVRVALAGNCVGCTASTATLRGVIEEALRDGVPGFASLEVDDDGSAAPHPPPQETVVTLGRKPA